MKNPLTAFVLILLASAAATAAVTPVVALQSTASVAAVAEPAQPAQAPASAATPPAPLVTGLPDFTRLVEQVGPAVVNVEVLSSGRGLARRGGIPADDIPEIFRRFFGPGFGIPEPGDDEPGAPRRVGLGTGFIISSDGYILTNHHVIDGADEVRVTLTDRREFTAKVVGSDQMSDVALLKIDATGLPVLRPGDASAVKPGQWAIAIGSPFGFEQSVTAGIVSAVGRSNPYADQRYVPFIQTDVAINRGNSGGPLLNTRGEVIGINSQIFSNSGGYMGVSFAIPIDVAMNVVSQLKEHGEVRRGQLGVTVEPMTSEKAKGIGLPDTLGALVNEVMPGSPAEKAGIEPMDVIRSVDGVAVRQSSDLPPLIGNKAPGTKVRLKVFRDGRERDVEVTLTRLDESALAGVPAQGRGTQRPAEQTGNALGITGRDLDEAQRRQFGLKPGEGVLVVRAEGAARRAGIMPGTVILQVGRKPVGSAAALERELREVRPGQTVMLLVRTRSGGTQFVPVTPREGDD